MVHPAAQEGHAALLVKESAVRQKGSAQQYIARNSGSLRLSMLFKIVSGVEEEEKAKNIR
jgi:hypothetical protein